MEPQKDFTFRSLLKRFVVSQLLLAAIVALMFSVAYHPKPSKAEGKKQQVPSMASGQVGFTIASPAVLAAHR
jgi:hypothetical protein